MFTQRDATAEPVPFVRAGQDVLYDADADLRDFENVPLTEDVDLYFEREVEPHVPDAWMDPSKDKVGYEINFNRHFYVFTPSRPLAQIDAELKTAEDQMIRLLREVTKRKASIAMTATRGLDPKAKLRDSGVPWLGEIPAHWATMRIRHLISAPEQAVC